MSRNLKVAMIGYGFMGKTHSLAYRAVNRLFSNIPIIEMNTICGRNYGAVNRAKESYGWLNADLDWKNVIAQPDIDIIDICTSGDMHKEIAIAALEAGKHVLCEKPLANNVEESQLMYEAAKKAESHGIRSMVAFNYRRVPALAHAKKLITDGRLGQIYHVRAHYLQDWILDPQFPLVWRLNKEISGSGALGDLGSHIIDLAQYLCDSKILTVSGQLKTFIETRPLPGKYVGLKAEKSLGSGKVTVDDSAVFTANFDNGALGIFEATRFAAGRKNAMSIEINGAFGSLFFNFESMNELFFHDHKTGSDISGFTKIQVTESSHPYMSAWWPPGHIIGYEHTFIHQLFDFLHAIANNLNPSPSFEDGNYVQKVLHAIEVSANNSSALTKV